MSARDILPRSFLDWICIVGPLLSFLLNLVAHDWSAAVAWFMAAFAWSVVVVQSNLLHDMHDALHAEDGAR